jgi:hypothetical protein
VVAAARAAAAMGAAPGIGALAVPRVPAADGAPVAPGAEARAGKPVDLLGSPSLLVALWRRRMVNGCPRRRAGRRGPA